MRIYLLLAAATGLSFIGSNCGGSGVGDPCVPEDEYLTGFSGFDDSEVNVESKSFQCQTRVCLVNHFAGRVTCPYGQKAVYAEDGSTDPRFPECMGPLDRRNSADCQPGGAAHALNCQVPERDGSRWEDRINVEVPEQYQERQAVDAVYCSCRCAGEDKNARYCECGTGFICEKLVDNLGHGKGQLSGSYCVKEGTIYDAGNPPALKCNADTANCNADYNYERDGGGVSGRNQKAACLPQGAVCGDDDQCCTVEVVGCEDDQNANGYNCFGHCVGNQCQAVDFDGDDIPGALEVLYEVTREDCKSGDVCGANN